MESTFETKMDALKQTIKSLREKRNQLEKDLDKAQSDAKKNKTQHSRLDEQLKKEKSIRSKLEQHLLSLGVEVDKHGNIKNQGTSSTQPKRQAPKEESDTKALPSVKLENPSNPLKSEVREATTTPISNDTLDVKIKIKKGKKDEFPLPLPLDVRARFLKGATLFPIDPDPLQVAVGRYALNKAYGSATVQMSWTKDNHRFLWPSYDWNPDMPRGPGEPGLLLEVKSIYCEAEPRSLFYKIRKSNPALWAYAGEYMGREAGKLWKEEYAALGDVVHMTRARQMLQDRSIPDGASIWQRIKARIVLRKRLPVGVQPTEEQIQAELIELSLDSSQEYPADYLTCQDITDAYIRGDEHLVVTRLECVGYDHAKAAEFINVQKNYEEAMANKKKNSKGASQGRKRKDISTVESSDSASDEEEDVEEIEEVPRPSKRSKRTAPSNPEPSSSTATLQQEPSTPSSVRSARARTKSRKLLGLE